MLTDRQQGILLALAFILPPVINWLNLGFPTDRPTLGWLFSAVLGGVLAFIMEALGTKTPVPTPPTTPVTPSA